MVFSSTIFLFAFLPIVLAGHFLMPRQLRNLWLLVASLLFYAWGEKGFVVVMLASIVMNYLFGVLVDCYHERAAKPIVTVAIIANLALLAGFKYANLLAETFNALFAPELFPPWNLAPVHLPIGISFFTFHSLSYVIDVYRGDARAQRNPFNIALYIALFPQLIAGPILRYHDVADQIISRTVTLEGFAYGIRRFVMGLAKKVLIANLLAETADKLFTIPAANITTPLAWLGTICYTLQIYFDFSGYSDMAVGLGKMFGFTFVENFNYPYIARSIKEFWQRWHISLSMWFRDYLYLPLGGNRCSPGRVYFNLLTVFFFCGLWHGASWSFVFWGFFHGFFLVLERQSFMRWLNHLWWPMRHAYTLLIVMVGWIFFRVEKFSEALRWVGALAGFGGDGRKLETLAFYLDPMGSIALGAGMLAAMPLLPALAGKVSRTGWQAVLIGLIRFAAIIILLILCAMQLAAGTYNPFIYFRF